MQYYTKQQLQGAGRFHSGCRIGNWNEDLAHEESILAEYKRKRECGELLLDHHQRRVNAALAPVSLSSASGEMVSFGDVVILKHSDSGAVLATDIDDAGPTEAKSKFNVSGTSTHTAPCARNAFRIKPLEDSAKGFVRYGDKIKLQLVVFDESLSLRSQPRSTLSFSKPNQVQDVYISTTDMTSYSSAWTVQHPDPKSRLLLEGEPVSYAQPIVLQHSATGRNLSILPGADVLTDFGKERDIYCKTIQKHNMSGAMEHMTLGKTAPLLEKNDTSENFWILIGK